MANVIEILLRAKDETGATLGKFKSSLISLKGAIAGIAAGAALNAIIDNMKEAQEATTKLNSAFANTGKTVGVTRQRMDELATQIQNTTTVSDELVKTAESVLLSFDNVRGQAFERTIKVATDLSARLGGDLVDAVKSVGFALQSPEEGLTRLRRAGIQFSDDQQGLIKALADAGRLGEAQSVVLTELERRYGGAAEAARNTLGGALKGLKNAFGELFEGGEKGTSGATDAINALSKALQSEDLKRALNFLIAGLANLIEVAAKATAAIAGVFAAPPKESVDLIDARIQRLKDEIADKQRGRTVRGAVVAGTADDGSGPAIYSGRGHTPQNVAALRETIAAIEEYKKKFVEAQQATNQSAGATPGYPVTAKEGKHFFNPQLQNELEENIKWLDAFDKKQKELAENTRTATQVKIDAAKKENDEVAEALRLGIINQEQAAEKTKEITEKYLAEIDTNGYRKKIVASLDETNQILIGGLRRVGESIQQTFSDMFYNGKLSIESLRDVVRRVLADIAASILTSNIAKYLQSQFNLGGDSGSGAGYATIFASLASAFGGKASGGYGSGWKVVGEDGPELVNLGGGSMVQNARQMAFARGGGGSLSYAPQFNLTMQGGEDQSTLLFQQIRAVMERDKEDFKRMLEKNGIPLR